MGTIKHEALESTQVYPTREEPRQDLDKIAVLGFRGWIIAKIMDDPTPATFEEAETQIDVMDPDELIALAEEYAEERIAVEHQRIYNRVNEL